MINIKVDTSGLLRLKAELAAKQKQVKFAASKALTTMAFGVNSKVKGEMKQAFKGGATPYTLRAFKVEKATKQSLTAVVALRKDAPDGGTSYTKALSHLFSGGTREWKKLEGLLRRFGLIPSGMMAVPGDACPLDSRGNMRKAALNELLGVIRSNLKNLRVFRRSGAGKQQKAIGYFVVLPSDKTKLHPGIWKRLETGTSSTVKPMIMYVRPGKWRSFINLQQIGDDVVKKSWQSEFDRELANALRTAR